MEKNIYWTFIIVKIFAKLVKENTEEKYFSLF